MAKQLDIALIEKSLTLERFENPDKIEWLDKSFDVNSDFWRSLFKIHDGFFGSPGKSVPFRRYDFFHDIIVRNQNRGNPAFIWYDPTGGWKKMSYRELGEESERTGLSWLYAGVRPGDTVCIVKTMGKGFITSLLAGLRTGVVLSFVMPRSKSIMKRQLDALDPDYICTEDIYMHLLSNWREKIVDENPGVSRKNINIAKSHTYVSGDTAALLFDPMCEEIFIPKKVTADFFFFSGIRDGIIGLGLDPGKAFAAPGFDEVLTQPSFLFSVLLNGATYVHCSVSDIEKQPELLKAYPLRVLGVSLALRNFLMEHPVSISETVQSWFRNPSEDSDILAWNMFINKVQLDEIPAGCMVWNASMGGCLLFSFKRKGQVVQHVLPMPGRKWQLGMIGNTDTMALGGTGVFAVSDSLQSDMESYISASCILSKTHPEYLFAGLSISSRKGIFYPVDFINKIVRRINFCRDSFIIEIPNADGRVNSSRFHLLIFTGHKKKQFEPALLISMIREKINSEAGRMFNVDDIILIPFCPRRGDDNEIDRQWCSFQYLNGRFEKKLKDELFLDLSRLRCCALELC